MFHPTFHAVQALHWLTSHQEEVTTLYRIVGIADRLGRLAVRLWTLPVPSRPPQVQLERFRAVPARKRRHRT